MTTTINEKTYEYRGLSTDVKPMEKAGNGSVFIEMDTGKVYIFDEENLIWIELSKKSGDSDTGSGGSGGGADITSNVKIVANKNDILSTSDHNKLCILSDASSLAIKVVDKIEGGAGSFIANSQLLENIFRPVCGVYKNCIYFAGGSVKSSLGNDRLYKYDISTNAITKIKNSDLKYGCGTIVGNKMYIFGDAKNDNTTMIIDLDTLEYTNNNIGGVFTYGGQCCASIGTDVYVFGGHYYSNYNDYYYKKITKIDTLTNTTTILSTEISDYLYASCCASIGNCIYIFGSAESSYSKNIYKFNSLDGSFTRLSVSLPIDVKYYPCVTYGKFIYIFARNNIIIFDSENETCEYLTSVSSVSFEYSGACINGNNVYLIGGNYNKNNYTYNITFDLPANNVYIFIDNSSKFNFDLIADQVTIPIKNIYIGDSNNTAQLANAYLYDETQSAWVNINTGEVLS